MVRKCILLVLAACLLAAAASIAAAQYVPYGPYPGVVSGGFTHSFQKSVAYGPFAPPVGEVAEQYYEFPGLSPFGAYPGGGYAYDYGLGMTPNGYGPYGGFTYL